MVEKEKLDDIEERLRVIVGGGNYAFADMAELCLVPDVVIPPKFKVSDFNKYKGTTCPKNHLKVYYISSRKVLLGQLSPGILIRNLPESILGRT